KVWNYLKNQCEGISAGDSTLATDKTLATGKTIYKTTGKRVQQIDNHVQSIGCAGQSNVKSRRGDCDNVDFTNQEATVIVQFTNDCKCGDELTIKHWGPNHKDGECCWEIGCINQSGEVGRVGEGPHPKTTSPKPTKVFGNIGKIKGAKIGVKSIVWKTSDGGHHEMWVDKTASGNNWQKVAEWEFTSWGGKGSDGMQGEDDGKNTNEIASNQTLEFRCDCEGAEFSNLSVDEIVPDARA
ncbi:MAG TPA: hypothetical protein VE076_06600, partial [Nitrososphaeraceae archaeon]|nr:hypothetical protein [Nitrososphaeraceae archaeon]